MHGMDTTTLQVLLMVMAMAKVMVMVMVMAKVILVVMVMVMAKLILMVMVVSIALIKYKGKNVMKICFGPHSRLVAHCRRYATIPIPISWIIAVCVFASCCILVKICPIVCFER